MSPELRGIIFDFDGTMAYTERDGQRVAFNRAFSAAGLDWHWSVEIYADLLKVAGGKERLHYYLARYRPDLLERAVKDGLIDEIHRLKTHHFEAIAPTIPFRAGVQRLIYDAHFAGVRVAIATSASMRAVTALLRQDSALPGMIDAIATSETVERKKPAPDVYLAALERLALSADECVAIEDSRIGVEAALGAGLTTVVTVSEYSALEAFPGAAAVLTELGDYDRAGQARFGPAPPHGIVDLAFLSELRASALPVR